MLRILDRVLCNQHWFDKFRTALVDVPAANESDHCHLNITIVPELQQEPRPFKYQHFWSEQEDFVGIVKGCWEKEIEGDDLYTFHCGLKDVRKELSKLNRSCFSNISSRVEEKQIELEGVNKMIYDGNLDPLILTKATNLKDEYKKLSNVESQFYQSKARMQWFKDGDASASFFHRQMRFQQAKNRIIKMKNCDGVLIEDYEKVKELVADYYKEFFAAKDCVPCEESVAEIEGVILGLKSGKALGPDGFSTEFYKDVWPVVKTSVFEAVKTFFTTSIMPKFINNTTISLIPKVQEPLLMKLKDTLQGVIGIQQTAYVPGRSVSDGIMLMQELVCGYDRKSGAPRCAIKVDIMKAYDTLQWDFLWVVLKVLEYPVVFVNWLKACVQFAWFSVSINRNLNGYFKSERGVRQSDSLSLYLFIIVMDYFSELLKSKVATGDFDFHPRYREIGVVNINFADDLFILCRANEKSLKTVKRVLAMFGDCSDLKPNLAKSTCYFARIVDMEEVRLSNIMGIPISALPVRYLGIPLTTKQISSYDCRVLVDKVRNRIEGWGCKHFSFVGRVTLINSVLFGVCNYWCQTTFLPIQTVEAIEKTMNQYLRKGAIGVKERSIDSWVWRKLLMLRDAIKPHEKYKVEDGKIMNYLYDNWSSEGVMVEAFSARERSVLGLLSTDSVADFCRNMKWPKGRRFTENISRCKNLLLATLSDAEDRMVWFEADRHCTSLVWDGIRVRTGLRKGFKSKLRRVCITAAVYHIWKCKNVVVFENRVLEVELVTMQCIQGIKSRVSSWRNIKRTKTNWRACIDWGLIMLF
ncbi:hypothetical protein LIER_20108 [Lithospermum erythrorhizon]|uniref:Reverse transcriptase domain-containing protein n=1 Tax=Lithospermum erythrorhizon TaxID=34254 RepID=A0AAV3QQY5_LITER